MNKNSLNQILTRLFKLKIKYPLIIEKTNRFLKALNKTLVPIRQVKKIRKTFRS